jgi:hypothetical protein
MFTERQDGVSVAFNHFFQTVSENDKRMNYPAASPPKAGKQSGIALNSDCGYRKRRGIKPAPPSAGLKAKNT